MEVTLCYKRNGLPRRLTAASRSRPSTCRGRVVFLLGAEREGLPAEVERDVDARIPIAGVESLNVAISGALALYERARQHHG